MMQTELVKFPKNKVIKLYSFLYKKLFKQTKRNLSEDICSLYFFKAFKLKVN